MFQELQPGNALIIKKNGTISQEEIITPTVKKACSFERIYFSRGSDAEIYQERKHLGRLILPAVLDSIDDDTDNTVFSYKCTNFYNKASEDCLLWNDPDIGINWNIENPLLSDKDLEGKRLKDFVSLF